MLLSHHAYTVLTGVCLSNESEAALLHALGASCNYLFLLQVRRHVWLLQSPLSCIVQLYPRKLLLVHSRWRCSFRLVPFSTVADRPMPEQQVLEGDHKSDCGAKPCKCCCARHHHPLGGCSSGLCVSHHDFVTAGLASGKYCSGCVQLHGALKCGLL